MLNSGRAKVGQQRVHLENVALVDVSASAEGALHPGAPPLRDASGLLEQEGSRPPGIAKRGDFVDGDLGLDHPPDMLFHSIITHHTIRIAFWYVLRADAQQRFRPE